MKYIWILILFPVWSFGQNISDAEWAVEEIAKGIKWKRLHSDQYFESKQYINILEIDTSYQFDIEYEKDTLVRTSGLAKRRGAVAAVNGGFFDMKNGGSVTYLEINDSIINNNGDNFVERKNEVLEGLIGMDKNGKLVIAATEKFLPAADYKSALITGPLLLLGGKAQPLVDRAFTNNRHPRTCACTTNNGKALLITVDGRNKEAAGMSLQELTQLTKMLHCQNAINLDGGGSTTMYTKKYGILNHPSDNRRFDKKGERPCANAIIVF